MMKSKNLHRKCGGSHPCNQLQSHAKQKEWANKQIFKISFLSLADVEIKIKSSLPIKTQHIYEQRGQETSWKSIFAYLRNLKKKKNLFIAAEVYVSSANFINFSGYIKRKLNQLINGFSINLWPLECNMEENGSIRMSVSIWL